MDSIKTNLKQLIELYDKISFYMPFTYVLLMVGLEFYLLFRNKNSVYVCTLALCYGYVIFLSLSFYNKIYN